MLLAVATMPACRRGRKRSAPVPGSESRSLDVTSWTEETELYMEHPPLVAGQTVRFAVHLTRLADFQALNAGRPSIEMSPESGGAAVVLPGSEPLRARARSVWKASSRPRVAIGGRWSSRAGSVRPPRSRHRGRLCGRGRGNRRRRKASGERPDGHRLPEGTAMDEYVCDRARARRRDAHVDPGARRDRAGHRRRGTRRGPGRWTLRVARCRRSAIACPPARSLGVWSRGCPSGGDDRATLDAAVTEAQAAARRREGRPRARGAAAGGTRGSRPARRRGAARRGDRGGPAHSRRGTARPTRRGAAQGGGAASGNAFVLRAPIAGRVAEVFAALGASYDEGAPLFRVVRSDRVELQAQVPPSEAAAARDRHGGGARDCQAEPTPSSSSPTTCTTPA